MDILKSFSLEGKVALITGASYGIGYGIATAFAAAGAKIVFNDINQELVDKGLASYKEDGIDAKGYVCDVTNEDMVNDMVKKIEEEIIHGESAFRRKKIFAVMIKYLCPIFVLIILISSVANAFGWISM